jgi:hypothetical protein
MFIKLTQGREEEPGQEQTQSGDKVINFCSLSLMLVTNKLECLWLTPFDRFV